MENAMSEGELLPCPALPKRRVCIPHPHEPDKRVVGFVIEQADEAWGELGISEPLFWLDRILATLSPPAQSNASAEAKPTHWHNGMGQVLTDVQKVVADSEDGVYASRFSEPLFATPAVPEGFVLVPREPTEAMRQAGADERAATQFNDPFSSAEAIYSSMLAAAPPTSSAVGAGEPTHWHNGMGQVLSAGDLLLQDEVARSRFCHPLYSAPVAPVEADDHPLLQMGEDLRGPKVGIARRLAQAAIDAIHHDAQEPELGHELAELERQFRRILAGNRKASQPDSGLREALRPFAEAADLIPAEEADFKTIAHVPAGPHAAAFRKMAGLLTAGAFRAARAALNPKGKAE